jgi:hypothetical protein
MLKQPVTPKEAVMNGQNLAPVEAAYRRPPGMQGSAGLREILLALGPFLLWPCLLLLGRVLTPLFNRLDLGDTGPVIGTVFTLTLAAFILLMLLVGIVKDFPRWCFPYWGFTVLITLYLWNFTGTISGAEFRGAWWVWIPLFAVILTGLLWRRSLEPLRRLFVSIWKDWTLLSFTVYGLMPLMLIAAYDEVRNNGPVLTVLMLILAAGAYLYMQRLALWERVLSLLGGFLLSWLVGMAYLGFYWNGRLEPGMEQAASWANTLTWSGQMGAALAILLLVPFLIAVLRFPFRRRI